MIQCDSSIGLYWRGVLISFEEKRQDSLDGGSDQLKASGIKTKIRDLVSKPNRPTCAVDSSSYTCYRSASLTNACGAAGYTQCVSISAVAGSVRR